MSTPTPHNAATKEQITKTVIMPGDPLRSKFIAETFLENPQLINNVRGIQGYVGTYKGVPVTVMAHGMGNPSLGIYTYELFNFYDVENIIRVGSIGAMQADLKIKDIIIAEQTYTKTNYDNFVLEHGEGFISASKELVDLAKETAENLGLNAHIGSIYCSDTFYTREDQVGLAKEKNLLGVEMESAALYINANNANKKALTICTVSDNLITQESAPSEVRQTGFTNMMKLALEMAVNV
jgi:purine-nucleoside phosphorylase